MIVDHTTPVGTKIICIEPDDTYALERKIPLQKGQVYTIRCNLKCGDASPSLIFLEEIHNRGGIFGIELGYISHRFEVYVEQPKELLPEIKLPDSIRSILKRSIIDLQDEVYEYDRKLDIELEGEDDEE